MPLAAESLLVPLLLLATLLHPRRMLSQALEWAPLRWVGRLSYSLYLWQQFFLSEQPRWTLQRFPVSIALLVITAWASYELLERPLLRLGHRLAPPVSPGRTDAGGVTAAAVPAAHAN